MPEIRWSRGPHELRLDGRWMLPLPGGVVWASGAGMRRFLAATGNSLTGRELAVFGAADLSWFVVVSGAGTTAGELAWTEESREADGREVVIHSVVHSSHLFELVSEKAGAESARRTVEPILAGVHDESPQVSPWWLLLVLPVLLLLIIRRRRQ